MAIISIGGYEFSIDPTTASWNYRMNIKSTDTYGGRVVQLLACVVENMTVQGYIYPDKWVSDRNDANRNILNKNNQWNGMRSFEHNIRLIMGYHETARRPVDFDFPEVGWSGKVYVTGYSDVRFDPGIPAVTYTLSMAVDSGFDSIASAAGDYGMKSMPDGVGWVRSVYNTPDDADWEKVKKALEKVVDEAGTFDADKVLDFYDYIEQAEGVSDDASGDNKDSDEKKTVIDAIAGSKKAVTLTYTASEALKVLGLVSNWSDK